MQEVTFINLSKEKSKNLHNNIFENAKRLKFDSSTLVSVNESYSSASSLLILSSEEVIKAILSKGELFGEKAILGDEIRDEFAQSVDNTTSICPVDVNTMHDLMRDNRGFSFRIYKLIGIRLKRLERRLELVLFKDAETRVQEFLKELAVDYGYCCPDTGDTVVKHPYTQNDIAKLLGTSRPTLNAILNKFKANDIIDFSRNEIRLKVLG